MIVDLAARLGELEAVADAERGRGNTTRVVDEEGTLRGLPPYAEMARPLDPDLVETEFDLGWMVCWWPRAHQAWDLVNLADGVSLRSGTWSPFARHRSAPAPAGGTHRRRIGWAADHPLFAPERGSWTEPWRAVVSTEGSATEFIERLDEILAVLPGTSSEAADPAALAWPDWLRAAWMPERHAVDWRSWHREVRGLPAAEAKRRRWRATWTRDRWERAVLPSERTWRVLGAEPSGDRSATITLQQSHPAAPKGPLTWLLDAAGAVECHPDGKRAAGRG